MNAGISWPDAIAGVYSNVSFGEGFFLGWVKKSEFGVEEESKVQVLYTRFFWGGKGWLSYLALGNHLVFGNYSCSCCSWVKF